MPLYMKDLDVVSEAAGLSSALIVPCNMCPAVTVAVNEGRPFMQLFRVIEGMEVVGFMNAKMEFRPPANVSIGDCETLPIRSRNHIAAPAE